MNSIADKHTNKFLDGILRRPSWIIAVLAVITVIILGMLYRISCERQAELEIKLDQQTELLERQNLVIDGLTAKQEEQDRLLKETIPVVTSELLKEEISALSELVTRQYIYTNADKLENDQTWIFGWSVPFSSKSLLITYNGVIKAGVDLSEVLVDVDDDAGIVTITLPESKITDNYIPQESITVVEAKDGLFNEVTFDNYNQLVSEQKIVMEQKAINSGFIQEADKEARAIVKSIVSLLPGMSNYKLIVE